MLNWCESFGACSIGARVLGHAELVREFWGMLNWCESFGAC